MTAPGGSRRGPATLRGRIALVSMLATAAWVVVLTVGLNVALSAQLQQQADSVLRTRGEAVATTVEVSPTGAVVVREVGEDRALDVGTWIFAGTDVLESPSPDGGLDEVAASLSGRGEQAREVGSARVLALPVLDSGRQVATVVTSVSLLPYQETARIALVGSALLALLLLAGVYAVVRVSTDRALRPVQDMIEQADRWSASADAEHRFGTAERPTELDDLARTLDALLDRISAVVRHERVFSEQLSHELRTPLAAVVAEASLARLTAPDGDVGQGLARVEAAADRMTGILDTLMTAARSDGASAGRCNVDVVVRRGVAGRGEVALDIEDDVVAGVDAPVLERLLSPLLDNAFRHAEALVTVVVAADSDGVHVAVRDDGAGISVDDLERVFDPGWRRRPDDGHDGAGLGLSLVRRLAVAVGGSVEARPGPGGVVILRLPRG